MDLELEFQIFKGQTFTKLLIVEKKNQNNPNTHWWRCICEEMEGNSIFKIIIVEEGNAIPHVNNMSITTRTLDQKDNLCAMPHYLIDLQKDYLGWANEKQMRDHEGWHSKIQVAQQSEECPFGEDLEAKLLDSNKACIKKLSRVILRNHRCAEGPKVFSSDRGMPCSKKRFLTVEMNQAREDKETS